MSLPSVLVDFGPDFRGVVTRQMSLRRSRKILALVGLLAALVPASALAVELRDAELVAGGEPVLQNGSGTVRLEDARLGRLGPPVFVPEPGALWQLGSGIGLLALLAERRRRRTASQRTPEGHRRDTGAPGPADSAAQRQG